VRSGPVKPGLHWYTPELTFSVEFFEMHGPPFGPEHHASHMQSVMFSLPTDEFEFSGQSVQAALPFVGLYVPGTQSTHGPPSGPVKRVLQRQFVISPLRASAAAFAGHIMQLALAAAAYCSAGHISHVILLSAATVGEYIPTEQLVQSALPFEALYVPGRQALHCPLEAPVAGPVKPALHEHCISLPQVGGTPYTSTSTNCSRPVVSIDILTYLPNPLHTCVLDHGDTIAPFCPVAQFAKVTPSFESCI
jgi:hypothetical protein